jgi:hypothetical protein
VDSKFICAGDWVEMTCHDFEPAWNELLDAEAGAHVAGSTADACPAQAVPGLATTERSLLEHAASCPTCNQVAIRYQALRRAIRQWGPPPVPSAELADRILTEVRRPTPSPWAVYGPVRRETRWPFVAGFVTIATVAAAVAIALPILGRIPSEPPEKGDPAVAHVTGVGPGLDDGRKSVIVVADRRTLNNALAEATAATWDLARSASEPAARISRQMLDVATGPEQNRVDLGSDTNAELAATSVSVPSLDLLTPDTAAAGALLQKVGDRLATGVRPLSDTARHAFGFLLGPTLSKPEVHINPPAQKGA